MDPAEALHFRGRGRPQRAQWSKQIERVLLRLSSDIPGEPHAGIVHPQWIIDGRKGANNLVATQLNHASASPAAQGPRGGEDVRNERRLVRPGERQHGGSIDRCRGDTGRVATATAIGGEQSARKAAHRWTAQGVC
jgi:hypothetical protein